MAFLRTCRHSRATCARGAIAGVLQLWASRIERAGGVNRGLRFHFL